MSARNSGRMKKRSIRLHVDTVAKLRDLRDSHITPVPIPELVRRCLKRTQGVVGVENTEPTTRRNSTIITVWLGIEHCDLNHNEIVNRVEIALSGIDDYIDRRQIAFNRSPNNYIKER